MSEPEQAANNSAPVAFGLVIAAGAATCIGASLVFFPKLVKLANRRVLAASLGMATGVMIYISLVDIYGKSITGFEESGHDEGDAFIYATLTFFGGILLMMFINKVIIDWFVMGMCSKKHHICEDSCPNKSERAAAGTSVGALDSQDSFNVMNDPVHQYENIQYIADRMENKTKRQETISESVEDDESLPKEPKADEEQDGQPEGPKADEEKAVQPEEPNKTDKTPATTKATSVLDKTTEEGKLMQMGIATAIAIALHNFPEGLVTFVAYMSDATVGVLLCIGIALHNIPEGVVVSLPIYYATGNRLKAFLWGSLSGVSEPLGALIGWAALKQSGFSGNTYGILFGLVSGIMTYITIDELIPTALSYDPKNTIVTYAVIIGMLIVAASLMIFST